MSRSYHVTKKQVTRAAYLEQDFGPLHEHAQKKRVKADELLTRELRKRVPTFGDIANRAIVANQKARTRSITAERRSSLSGLPPTKLRK